MKDEKNYSNYGGFDLQGGTGLGLAIVKHICNKYNAPINVKSKPTEGTKIKITFPQK